MVKETGKKILKTMVHSLRAPTHLEFLNHRNAMMKSEVGRTSKRRNMIGGCVLTFHSEEIEANQLMKDSVKVAPGLYTRSPN